VDAVLPNNEIGVAWDRLRETPGIAYEHPFNRVRRQNVDYAKEKRLSRNFHGVFVSC
jgi:hypothetical protein